VAESIVQVTEGSGKKLHTNSYTVGANTVEDEAVFMGPFPYATYAVVPTTSISVATANDHVLCLNAGASLKVRVHRIRVEQSTNATAVLTGVFQVLRTTTGAPTGGTAYTPASFDTSDAASGAAARALPGVKGTESTVLLQFVLDYRQALLATSTQVDDAWEWTQGTGKPIIIPAGTTNGLVIKTISAIAGATVNAMFEFTETAF
jgi:predicted secreted protein